MHPLMSAAPVVGLPAALPQPFTKRKLSGRQLMCQKQAVKFIHVIHIRSEGGCEEEEEEEEEAEGAREGWRGDVTKAGLMLWQL